MGSLGLLSSLCLPPWGAVPRGVYPQYPDIGCSGLLGVESAPLWGWFESNWSSWKHEMVSLEQLVDNQVVPPKAAPSISGGTTSPSLSLAVTRGKVSSQLAHSDAGGDIPRAALGQPPQAAVTQLPDTRLGVSAPACNPPVKSTPHSYCQGGICYGSDLCFQLPSLQEAEA